MHTVLRALVVFAAVLGAHLSAAGTVHMVYEQELDGSATHRAIDLTAVGDGIDPVLQFILLDEPTDPATAQVLWQASSKPIHWNRTAEEHSWRFVDHAVLPAGSSIEYRLILDEGGLELFPLRHTRTEEDADFGVDSTLIDLLPDATYELQAHISVPDRPGKVLKQRITVSQFEEVVEPELPPVEELFPKLTPGSGFVGETPQPAAIGDKTTMAIARWDVVPEQTFEGLFEVGVLAFHSYGIDRVEMSFNGGEWKSIEAPSVNPRTSVNEYWAQIDARDVPDGKVEIRAVAYPKNGTPRVLETLVLFANAGGSVKFPVLELDAGSHGIPSMELPTEGWLIVRPKPGVAKADVVVWGLGRPKNAGNIKIEGLTMRVGEGGRGAGSWGKLWMNDVDYTGRTPDNSSSKPTWWIADHQWNAKYFTGMNISRVNAPFHTCTDGIIRNVVLKEIYEDVIRQAGLIVNVEVKDVSPFNPTAHPDTFQWYGQHPKNMIVYNFKANNVKGQGLFPSELTDCAFVNLDISTIGQYRPLQMMSETNNVLIQDSRFVGELEGVLRYDKGFRPTDLVLRNVNASPNEQGPPNGWEHREIKVYQNGADE